MITMLQGITYGSQQIEYRLLRRNRRTMQISVLPDLSVEVIAPTAATDVAIVARVRKRAAWILRQQCYFRQFLPRTPERRYIAGETHLYLGRRYRLKTSHGKDGHVIVRPGFIHLLVARGQTPQALLQSWLAQRAHDVLPKRIEVCLQRFPEPERIRPKAVIIRTLSSRWGSHTAAGRLVLNRDLVRAHTREIDYVITHELCHRLHHNHGKAFFALLDRVMPDWKERKQRLEQRLA